MRSEIIYKIRSLYRDEFKIQAYIFGSGKKSVCIMGSMRGNEYQQIYTCSKLIQALKNVEREDRLAEGYEIMVIPCANPSSMNIQKRFWPIDNTDINRMYPGYSEGETTQRIAAGLFEIVQDYEYGIQFASNYMPGQFIPYISIMQTGIDYAKDGKMFGLPYVVLRESRPYDTTTLNYNWQIWNTKAFSLYTTTTERLDSQGANTGVEAVLNFLAEKGIIEKDVADTDSQIIKDTSIVSVRSNAAGMFESVVQVGQRVEAGSLLAKILNPLDGEVLANMYSSIDGIVYYMHANPLVYEHTAAIKIIPDQL